MQALRRIVRTALVAGIVTGLCFAPVLAGDLDAHAGWTLEQGVDLPSYALIEPRSRNLNLDALVLACEPANDHRILQLQLYLTNDGPLMPDGVAAGRAKHDPRAEIVIDDQVFPVGLLFAEDHVVLSDETREMFPRLSERLLDAIEQGTTMQLRFDLVAEPTGEPAAFDGEAVIDLQAGPAQMRGAAVAAVRRCATGAAPQSVAFASPRR
ncbi:hypothetical protein [Reyranella sp.]|jgi:hypothetical protein|uniref:hypothetical protein n=1 Tax=Reyranella sp. TaxID=1929291 RepID=UPI000BCE23FA|nr:hypothetical protein [Reyranella sp.]OYY47087.1 MAG: hypothetical protein B7Y57_02275 [Rhodospirillales bacterium 35-66-84]OYZ97107.1 MAG: hypothetical protein B7Y08_02635 [Rhodospirillales bacterium 24-66-33]OZB27566.1 MAG: hypothetical protein B7X63_02500 [Rhodospirillales bacterium 39-66-50]HQS14021.1 hypothetical protein [Reyranella sp.]HQT10506.1 hypothetical protein [Reyranella sp.]